MPSIRAALQGPLRLAHLRGRLRKRTAGSTAAAAQCTTLGALALLSAGLASAAQPAPEGAEGETQRVEVNGNAGHDLRQESIASKLVVNRAEIEKFGDSSLVDVLRRIPGISIAGGGLQPKDVRLRGLGAGYTQILLNGEAVPPNFSLDSLAPDLIERIEVVRSSTADTSAQAVAGSINIVLRRPTSSRSSDLKLSGGTVAGLGSAGLTHSQSVASGAARFSVGFALAVDPNETDWLSDVQAKDSAGAMQSHTTTHTLERTQQLSLGVTPRASWKMSEADSLAFDGLLQASRLRYDSTDDRKGVEGQPPAFFGNRLDVRNESHVAQGSMTWKSARESLGRFETRLNASLGRRTSAWDWGGFDASGQAILLRTTDSKQNDSQLGALQRATFELGTVSALGLGAELQRSRRSESRVQRESSPVGYPVVNLDEDYAATVDKASLYVQGEWAEQKLYSVYAGVRAELLRIETSGVGLDPVISVTRALTPTVQMLWNLAGTRDQFRLNFGRTFKAPTPRQLVPRLWVVNDNSPTNPNFRGNPDLRPERSIGIDAGFERRTGSRSMLAVNLYAKRIADVMTQDVFEEGGTWLSVPTNRGNARLHGLEFEWKGNTRELWDPLPNVDGTVSLSRNWSSLDAIPGPNNRIDNQPLASATLSLDRRLTAAPVTLGVSFSYQHFGAYQLTAEQSKTVNDGRALDAYATFELNAADRLRVSLTNLLAPTSTTLTRYADSTVDQHQRLEGRSFRRLRVVLELKL